MKTAFFYNFSVVNFANNICIGNCRILSRKEYIVRFYWMVSWRFWLKYCCHWSPYKIRICRINIFCFSKKYTTTYTFFVWVTAGWNHSKERKYSTQLPLSLFQTWGSDLDFVLKKRLWWFLIKFGCEEDKTIRYILYHIIDMTDLLISTTKSSPLQ